jgi:hypothetical protein
MLSPASDRTYARPSFLITRAPEVTLGMNTPQRTRFLQTSDIKNVHVPSITSLTMRHLSKR